jgi:hypothetical protein
LNLDLDGVYWSHRVRGTGTSVVPVPSPEVERMVQEVAMNVATCEENIRWPKNAQEASRVKRHAL